VYCIAHSSDVFVLDCKYYSSHAPKCCFALSQLCGDHSLQQRNFRLFRLLVDYHVVSDQPGRDFLKAGVPSLLQVGGVVVDYVGVLIAVVQVLVVHLVVDGVIHGVVAVGCVVLGEVGS